MNLPTPKNPRIKYVSKARMWVKTYFEFDQTTHKPKQVQEWSIDEPS